ncbi:MAG: KOW domain-containing RNA-binding protein [Oscillospiraceae bacterium]|nr:KOW domain-containing RNA-binding protein [Oscillospiraceae bacterium]MCL2279153.1 KOW domain-containing RNA-binding protein [Oscillospiraceae bacterium]
MKDDTEIDSQKTRPQFKTPKPADIVMSNNGRDTGKKLIVVEVKDDGYSLIADGKGRRCDKPKLKKNKHLTIIGKASGVVEEKLSRGDKVTNNEVRRALVEHTTESGVAHGR